MYFLSIGLMIISTGVHSSAQINLGKLKSVVKDKAVEAVKNAKDKAVNEAENKVVEVAVQQTETTAATVENTADAAVTNTVRDIAFEQTCPKVQAKGPKPAEVTVKSNIEDVYAAFYYYQELVEEAVEKKDVSYLCSPDAQKPFEILYKVIMKHPQKDASNTTNYSESYASFRYNQTGGPKLELIGEPVWSKNPDPYQKYLENVSWYVGKIDGTEDLNIQGYHLAEALAITKGAIESKDKYMTAERLASPEYQAIATRLEEVWADMSPEYKKTYSHLEGATSVDGAAAASARQKARWAAEAEAVKEANLENIKNSLEPVPASKWLNGPNPSLEAQCLAVANKTHPEVTFVKAVLMSPEWQYDYQWGNPVRRRVHCWCIYKMTNGYHRAVHMSFKQMNTGGGNWGALELHGLYDDDFKYVSL